MLLLVVMLMVVFTKLGAAITTANWSMAYLSFSNFTNITAYTYLNVAVRTTSTGKVRFRMKDAAQTGFVEFDATSNLYGLKETVMEYG
jgi:hypothetical protein